MSVHKKKQRKKNQMWESFRCTYITNWRIGEERRSFGSKEGTGFREPVVVEVTIDDESDLRRSNNAVPDVWRSFGSAWFRHLDEIENPNWDQDEAKERECEVERIQGGFLD